MDATFSAPVRFDGYLMVEVIDEAWKAATLPVEDIPVPQGAVIHADEDEVEEILLQQEEKNRWSDLGLAQLAAEGST